MPLTELDRAAWERLSVALDHLTTYKRLYDNSESGWHTLSQAGIGDVSYFRIHRLVDLGYVECRTSLNYGSEEIRLREMGEAQPKARSMSQVFEKAKQGNPNAICLFRVGDSYESYGDDSYFVRRKFHLMQSHRDGMSTAIVPANNRDEMVRELVEAGYQVAVFEESGDPTIHETHVRPLRRGDIIEIVEFDDLNAKNLRRVKVKTLDRDAHGYSITGVNMKGKYGKRYRLPPRPIEKIVAVANSTNWLPFVDDGEGDV